MFDVYLITAEQPAADILAKCRLALSAAANGRVALQLRAKHLPIEERTALARALRAVTREHAVPLLLNADMQLAEFVGADGIQLPELGPSPEQARTRLGAQAIVGASRHDMRGIHGAARAGASFATLSPVFPSFDKGPPLGWAAFAEISRSTSLPILALGGVTASNAAALVRAGACGVAVIREVFGAAQPDVALRALLDAVAAGRVGR